MRGTIKKLLAAFLLFSPAFARDTSAANTGGTALLFLTQPVSARSFAMGSATAGISDGANNIYGNPAALSHLKAIDVNYSSSKGQFDESLASFAYAKRGFGIGFLTYDGGPIDILSDNGTITTFTAESAALTTISMSVDGFISEHWGINYKFIKDTLLSGYSLETQAYDVAIMYTLFGKYSVGVISQNVGNAVSYRNTRELLPRATVVGVAYNSSTLLLTVDTINYQDGNTRVNYGTEFHMGRALFLRGGIKKGGPSEVTTMGAGLLTGKIQFDYGVDMSNDFNKSQKISFSIMFE